MNYSVLHVSCATEINLIITAGYSVDWQEACNLLIITTKQGRYMFKRLLITYKIHKRFNNLFVFFCLIILSGCGEGMSAESIRSLDSGAVNTQDNEEVNAGDGAPADFIKLSWLAPVSNADGSTLTDLAGYMIYYREEYADAETFSTDAGNVTYATIDDLSPGTWCFTVTAYDSAGIESNFSNYACKEV